MCTFDLFILFIYLIRQMAAFSKIYNKHKSQSKKPSAYWVSLTVTFYCIFYCMLPSGVLSK